MSKITLTSKNFGKKKSANKSKYILQNSEPTQLINGSCQVFFEYQGYVLM